MSSKRASKTKGFVNKSTHLDNSYFDSWPTLTTLVLYGHRLTMIAIDSIIH